MAQCSMTGILYIMFVSNFSTISGRKFSELNFSVSIWFGVLNTILLFQNISFIQSPSSFISWVSQLCLLLVLRIQIQDLCSCLPLLVYSRISMDLLLLILYSTVVCVSIIVCWFVCEFAIFLTNILLSLKILYLILKQLPMIPQCSMG